MARTRDASLAERNRRICLLRRNGLTFSEIADMEGISRVRVSQIVAEASPDIPEEEARAEIASLLEYAERKAVGLIEHPGYALAPNGRAAVDPDGNPLLNMTVVDSAIRTLVTIADRKARLYAADKPAKKPLMSQDDAMRLAMESLAQLRAEKEAEDRRLAAEDKRRAAELDELRQLRIIKGQVEPPPALPPAAEG